MVRTISFKRKRGYSIMDISIALWVLAGITDSHQATDPAISV
jgi:hypothetical protein